MEAEILFFLIKKLRYLFLSFSRMLRYFAGRDKEEISNPIHWVRSMAQVAAAIRSLDGPDPSVGQGPNPAKRRLVGRSRQKSQRPATWRLSAAGWGCSSVWPPRCLPTWYDYWSSTTVVGFARFPAILPFRTGPPTIPTLNETEITTVPFSQVSNVPLRSTVMMSQK